MSVSDMSPRAPDLSVRTRARILLALAIATMLAATWFAVDGQRTTALEVEMVTDQITDLKTAMLDQETGLRGYVQTREERFLEPFAAGRIARDRATAAGRRAITGHDPGLVASFDVAMVAARQWESAAAMLLGDIRADPDLEISDASASRRKALMDAFRASIDVVREGARARAHDRLDAARWQALAVVVAFVILFGIAALVLVEGRSRVQERRRGEGDRLRDDLQHAQNEGEAVALLLDYVRRMARGTEAGLGQRPGAEHFVATTRDETVAIVSVARDRALLDHERDSIADAVDRAAPVIANLRSLAAARQRAVTDALTGLPNASAVTEVLPRLAAQADRRLTNLAVVVLDLDHFKAVNDNFGHLVGDAALRATGAALAGQLRRGDFAGRWGGEEFILLLPHTDAAGAAQLAEKVRATIAALEVPGLPGGITASFGVAALPEHALMAQELVRRADEALYASKHAGRNRVTVAGSASPEPELLASPARLEAIAATGLLDKPADAELQRLARLAAQLADAPTAVLSLVGRDRQFFAAHHGLSPELEQARETPISHSFCASSVMTGRPLIAPDASTHPLLAGNPAVSEYGARAYAGVPVHGSGGHQLGTLCVIDGAPRPWTHDQLRALERLAAETTDLIGSRSPSAA